MKLHQTITLLTIALLLNGCREADEISGGDVPGYSPVLLSAAPVSPFTKAYVPQGMYDNFKVYAVSEEGANRTVVMNGYEVKFVTDDWSYVTDTQPLAYWNPKADRYLFAAGAPIDAVTAISESSMTLHLENNTEGSAMACEPVKIDNGSADFGETVNLRFGYAHCMVCVAFVKEATEAVSVKDIQLTPDAAIASKAAITYTYDWQAATPTATPQVSTTEKSAASLSYAQVSIPAGTTDAVLSATRYYCVPDADNTRQWTVSVTCDGEQKQASFENSETWKSGKNYIYVFSLTEKGPKLIKVISQEDEYFYCNDIVPQDEFSNTNMTE